MISKIGTLYKRFVDTPNKASILLLVVWAFLSRGLGLVREALVGRLTPIEADIFRAASNLNENIVTIFILGSVSVALLPQIIKLDSAVTKSENLSKDKQKSSKLYVSETNRANKYTDIATRKRNSYISWCIVVFSSFITFLCLFGIFFSRQILYLINANFFEKVAQVGKLEDYILLNQIFLLAPVIFAIKTVLGVFLNASKSFKAYSIDGFLSNIGSIIGLSVLYALFGLTGAGFGLVIGFIIACATFIWDANRLGFRFDLYAYPELQSHLKQSLILFLPRILIFPATRMAETLITIFRRDDGEIASLSLALNIQGVFYGLIVAVGAVFLPDIARILVEKGKNHEFWSYLWRYLKGSMIVSLIASVVTIIGAPLLLWLIRLLALSKQDSLLGSLDTFWLIIGLIAIGSIGIILQSIIEILNRYFIALEENTYPIVSSLFANFCAIVFSLAFTWYFGPAKTVMLGFLLNNLILSVLLAAKCYLEYRKSDLKE